MIDSTKTQPGSPIITDSVIERGDEKLPPGTLGIFLNDAAFPDGIIQTVDGNWKTRTHHIQPYISQSYKEVMYFVDLMISEFHPAWVGIYKNGPNWFQYLAGDKPVEEAPHGMILISAAFLKPQWVFQFRITINGDPYVSTTERWIAENPGTQTRLAVYYNENLDQYYTELTDLATIDYWLNDTNSPIAPDMIGHAKTQADTDKLIDQDRARRREVDEIELSDLNDIPF